MIKTLVSKIWTMPAVVLGDRCHGSLIFQPITSLFHSSQLVAWPMLVQWYDNNRHGAGNDVGGRCGAVFRRCLPGRQTSDADAGNERQCLKLHVGEGRCGGIYEQAIDSVTIQSAYCGSNPLLIEAQAVL